MALECLPPPPPFHPVLEGVGVWSRLLVADAGGRSHARQLRSLRVTTTDLGFGESAELLPSDLCPVLEEVSWALSPAAVSRRQRRAAYMRFLRRLGAAMGPGFERRRPAFRVGAYNGAPLPPRLAVWCAFCGAKLFKEETIYALGPGTQRHIDCEAFVLGSSKGELAEDAEGELHCPRRCHEEDDLFLVAAARSSIDTCSFPYACACGPELAWLGPGPGDATCTWLQNFLSTPGSLQAPRRYRAVAARAAAAAAAAAVERVLASVSETVSI